MGLKGFLFEKELTLQFNKELHSSIWDVESDTAEPTLRKDVRDKLLDIAKAWAEFANIPTKHIKNILFTGSLANYNYTDKSDIYLHVLVDYDSISKDFDFIYDYFKDKKLLWGQNHDITIKGFPVEMYAQPMSEKPHTNQGVYSVSSNKWIQAPTPVEINVEGDVVFMKKLQAFKEQIDDIISGKGSNAGIEKLKEKIRKMRGAAIGKSGEFSQENLIFKELRNAGYLEKLTNYHREKVDQELSLEGVKDAALEKAKSIKKKLKERLGESITDEEDEEEEADYATVRKIILDFRNKFDNMRGNDSLREIMDFLAKKDPKGPPPEIRIDWNEQIRHGKEDGDNFNYAMTVSDNMYGAAGKDEHKKYRRFISPGFYIFIELDDWVTKWKNYVEFFFFEDDEDQNDSYCAIRFKGFK